MFTAIIFSKKEALALPQKDRPLNFRITSKIYHSVFEAIGQASFAWDPRPTGVFKTEEASDIAVKLCFIIAEELERLGITTEQIIKN